MYYWNPNKTEFVSKLGIRIVIKTNQTILKLLTFGISLNILHSFRKLI